MYFFRETCVVVPLSDSSTNNYLLVSDIHQQNVYQLQPDTGELRSLFTNNIHTVALALDPARRIAYLAHVDGLFRRQYLIRRRSFDGNINSVIYNAPLGMAYL